MKRVQVSIPNIVLLALITGGALGCNEAQAPMLSDDALLEQLMESERQFFGALKARDAEAVRRLSGADAFYVHPPGIQGIETIIDDMTGYTVGEITVGPDAHLERIGDDAAVLAYSLDIGWPTPSVNWFMTAVYVNRDGQWIGISRVETRNRNSAAQNTATD